MFADPCRAKAFRSGPTPVWVWNRRTLFCSLQSCFQFVFPICLPHSLRCLRSISDFFILLQVLFERTRTFRAFVVVWNLYGFRILLLRGFCGVQDWLSEGEFVETCQEQFRVQRIRLSEAQLLGFLEFESQRPVFLPKSIVQRCTAGIGRIANQSTSKIPLGWQRSANAFWQFMVVKCWKRACLVLRLVVRCVGLFELLFLKDTSGHLFEHDTYAHLELRHVVNHL